MCHPFPDKRQEYYHYTMKNITTKAITLAAFSTLLGTMAFAQAEQHEERHCGSDIMMQKLYNQYPGLEAEAQATHAASWIEGKRVMEANQNRSTPGVHIIPVVFHIIHDYGTENISDAQILDQVAILNRDYRKLNADTSQIVAPFDTLAADCEIEFRLAQIDPNGNCTNGIDRIASMETYVGDDGSKLNRWPRESYMNVWVVKSMMNGVAGYAYYPGATDGFLYPYDGIIILHDYIGSIGTSSVTNSRALTHEVGHWLSLPHPWGSTNSPGVACGDDGILDTPETKGWTTCNLTTNDICVSGVDENVQNYMEYAYCSRMFTYDQKDAMHYALNASASDRNNLWTTANLAATGCLNTQPTCIPHADFDINRTNVCEGGSVTLTDESWTSSATSWQWTITGPTTLTSTSQNPVLSNLTVPGTYNVQLIATNSAGSDTMDKPYYFTVVPDQAVLTPLYSESFEDPNWYWLGYESVDRYGNGTRFDRISTVGYTGTSSALLNVYSNCLSGDVDELITPTYDMRFNTGLQLTFRYAYATAATATDLNTQSFRVLSSIDCGQTWVQRWTATQANMVTAGYCAQPYIPSSQSQWELVTVNLPANFNTMSNVRFKFEYTSPEDGVGNNLYIDDINILSTNVGIHENNSGASFDVYPNPGDGNSTIAYTLDKNAAVKCDITDVSGRVVSSVNYGEQGPGNYTMPMVASGTNLAAGTYMITMTIGDVVTTRMYVVTAE